LATFQTDREKRPKLGSRNTGVTKRRKEMAVKIQECEAGTECRHKIIDSSHCGTDRGAFIYASLAKQKATQDGQERGQLREEETFSKEREER
jgi:hypothetical protein